MSSVSLWSLDQHPSSAHFSTQEQRTFCEDQEKAEKRLRKYYTYALGKETCALPSALVASVERLAALDKITQTWFERIWFERAPRAQQGKNPVYFPAQEPRIVIKQIWEDSNGRGSLSAKKQLSETRRDHEVGQALYAFCEKKDYTHLVSPRSCVMKTETTSCLIRERLPLPLFLDISNQVKLYMDHRDGFAEVARQFTELWCRVTFGDLENWDNPVLIQAAREDEDPTLVVWKDYCDPISVNGYTIREGLQKCDVEVVLIRTARWDNVPLYVFFEGGQTHCRMGLIDAEHLTFKKRTIPGTLSTPFETLDTAALKQLILEDTPEEENDGGKMRLEDHLLYSMEWSLPFAMFPLHFDVVASVFNKHQYPVDGDTRRVLLQENALLLRCYQRLYAKASSSSSSVESSPLS